jgi:hypothetical protein
MSIVSPEIIGVVTGIVLLAVVIPLGYTQWRKSRRMYSSTIDPEVLHDYNCEFLDPLPSYEHPPDYETGPPGYEQQQRQHITIQIPQNSYTPGTSTTNLNDRHNL